MIIETIPNDQFRNAMNELINIWFKKWRDTTNWTNAVWDSCIDELTEVSHKYNYRLIIKIGSALVEELERRDKNATA